MTAWDEDPPPVRRLLSVSEEQPLWRIFPYKRAIQLFSQKQLALVVPELWEDPFENFLRSCFVDVGSADEAGLYGLTNTFYGQCWTSAADETDAMWRIYAPREERGIRLRVTAGRLFDVIYKADDQRSAVCCFLGEVQYLSEKELSAFVDSLVVSRDLLHSDGVAIARTLLKKRIQFAHEAEVRLLYSLARITDRTGSVLKFLCDPNLLIEHALLDPRWNSEEAEAATSALRAAGYSGTVEQSTLYREPGKKALRL